MPIEETGSEVSNAMVGLEDEFTVATPVVQEVQNQTTPEVQTNTDAAGNDIPPVVAESKETNTTQTTEEVGNVEEEKVTNVMFGDTNLAATTEVTTENKEVNSFSDFDTILNEVGVKDGNELKGRIEQWRSMEPEYQTLKTQNENLEKNLQAMPPELYQAMKASIEGSDWRAVLNSTPALDFNKKAEEVPAESLVEAFLPGKFSQEEWEEYNDRDGDPSIKKAIDMALEVSKDKFNAKKNEFKNVLETERARNEDYQRKFSESLNKANEYVKSQMPGISDDYVNNLNQKITKEGIVNHFYNPDGTLKETAALAFLKTTEEYEAYQKIRINNAVKEERNRMTQEMLSRGNATPNIRANTNSSNNELSPEDQRKIKEMNEILS